MLIEGKDIIIVGIRTTFARKYLLPHPPSARLATLHGLRAARAETRSARSGVDVPNGTR